MPTFLPLLLGLLLGTCFLVFARAQGPGERRVLTIGLLVAAVVYVGFALRAASWAWTAYEAGGAAFYGLLGWFGWRRAPAWLALGWALHPLWDVVLHLSGAGAAIAPRWYVLACVPFDLLVAGFIVQRSRVLAPSAGAW